MKTKKQISLLLAAVMLISIFAGIFATPSKPTFSDVPADHWAYEFVEKAAKEGWVAGVGNGLSLIHIFQAAAAEGYPP